MSQNIFEPIQIHNTIETPKDLCDISKDTKQKYKLYLETVGNEYLHSENIRNDNIQNRNTRNDNNRSLRI